MSKAEELMATVEVHHHAGQEICIEFLNRGFRVRLGCVTIALVDPRELHEWLEAYIRDPQSFHAEYLRRQAKEMGPGHAQFASQFIPPPGGTMGGASLGHERPTATGIMGMGGPEPMTPQDDSGDTVGPDEEPRNR